MAARKPKPPKTFDEVEAYIEQNDLRVDAEVFWNYFATSGWYDRNDNPVLNWKLKLRTWSGFPWAKKSKKQLVKEAAQKSRDRIREDYQGYLESLRVEALLDIKRDGGHLWQLCGWLIQEILNKRRSLLL